MGIIMKGDEGQSPFAGLMGKMVGVMAIIFIIGVALVFFGVTGYVKGDGLWIAGIVIIVVSFIGLICGAIYASKDYKKMFNQKAVYENNLMQQAYETEMRNKEKQLEIEQKALEEEKRGKKN